ncbi:MAG TPA: thiamine pyrophosphate-dependent dehydrogenase E1 component subunit alpha [Solirubrobacterales bacterium]|jgi:pyruvate dehydrogenase E1 component alpha subunit|nr:thiamine pyrophosphate-dependent dehydrogenase E1 component subunit alpha [Solirubrobacterales bacterium]
MSPAATEGKLLELFATMVRVRRFEEQVQRLFRENRLPGFVHVSIGQEAVAAGACAPLRDDDIIVTTHRGHGHVLAKGGNLDRMFAELFARDEGLCRGVGGSMHLIDKECGVLCANAIVGASIGLATGAAFSYQVRGTEQVALAFFGDGAVNTGSFHESLNLAAVWELPAIYVCENNGYAEMSPAAGQSKVTDVAVRGAAYGMPAVAVDGNDPLAVEAAVAEAVDRARAGDGPSLVECRTFRLAGHYEGDQERYRPADELESWREYDPLQRARGRLLAEGHAEAELEELVAAADRSLESAIGFAERGSLPAVDLEEITYAEDLDD